MVDIAACLVRPALGRPARMVQMIEEVSALRRAFERIKDSADFRADQRIWWIYMRNAAIEVASRADLPDLQKACDRVKAFPETLPDERARWLALRDAVARVLNGRG